MKDHRRKLCAIDRSFGCVIISTLLVLQRLRILLMRYTPVSSGNAALDCRGTNFPDSFEGLSG